MRIHYEYLSYDVWGNTKDGYEVNASYSTNDFTSFPDDVDDKLIIHSVKTHGFAPKRARYASFEVRGDLDYLDIEYHGRPLCGLRRIERTDQ